MTKEQADFLTEALSYCGVDHDVRDDYSGRSMYGKTTSGVVVDSPLEVIGAVVGYMKSLTENELKDVPDFGALKIDNMARQVILY